MEIKAFRALRYDSGVVGDVGGCLAPPYDVIDEPGQVRLYEKNDYNIVRIIKGKTDSADSERDNQYSRAAEYLAGWVENGALKADLEPAIYGYVQDFEIDGKDFRRSGFVALGRLEEFGKSVRPHEKTLDGPKADRLKLMMAAATQFGQIFMLYDDPEKIADRAIERAAAQTALIDFTDDNECRHRLYTIDNPGDIEAVAGMMSQRQTVIADGHHRYETALNYYNQTNNPAAQYRMMTFVNMRNPGLIILPTHRLVANIADFDVEKLLTEAGRLFGVAAFDFTDKQGKELSEQKMFNKMKSDFDQEGIAFGVYAASGAFYALTLKDKKAIDKLAESMSAVAAKLDVNVLHKLILEKILGIGEEQLAGQTNIQYIKGIGKAVEASIDKVDSGQSQVVFFMNPTRNSQVKAIAATGEKMPQKSTFFYPKVYTGLVINKL